MSILTAAEAAMADANRTGYDGWMIAETKFYFRHGFSDLHAGNGFSAQCVRDSSRIACFRTDNGDVALEVTILKPTKIKSLERVPFSGFDDAYYAREDKIEDLKKSIEQDKKTIKIIEDALDENFDHCAFDDTKNNSLTSKYCSIKNNQTSDLQNINLILYFKKKIFI